LGAFFKENWEGAVDIGHTQKHTRIECRKPWTRCARDLAFPSRVSDDGLVVHFCPAEIYWVLIICQKYVLRGRNGNIEMIFFVCDKKQSFTYHNTKRENDDEIIYYLLSHRKLKASHCFEIVLFFSAVHFWLPNILALCGSGFIF
jgi:hypothetical protein